MQYRLGIGFPSTYTGTVCGCSGFYREGEKETPLVFEMNSLHRESFVSATDPS